MFQTRQNFPDFIFRVLLKELIDFLKRNHKISIILQLVMNNIGFQIFKELGIFKFFKFLKN